MRAYSGHPGCLKDMAASGANERVPIGRETGSPFGAPAAASPFAGWTAGMPPRVGRRPPSLWIGPYFLILADPGRPSSLLVVGLGIVSGVAGREGWGAAECGVRSGVCYAPSGVNALTADARLEACPADAATTSNVFPRASGRSSSCVQTSARSAREIRPSAVSPCDTASGSAPAPSVSQPERMMQ